MYVQRSDTFAIRSGRSSRWCSAISASSTRASTSSSAGPRMYVAQHQAVLLPPHPHPTPPRPPQRRDAQLSAEHRALRRTAARPRGPPTTPPIKSKFLYLRIYLISYRARTRTRLYFLWRSFWRCSLGLGGRLYTLAHGMHSVGLVVVRVVGPANKG